ncbi:MAG: cysteine dioxygenase family protein [Candidatus Sericytochromatia bacterium]|nr:cysteine dioxygenase family protein [Candidatus Sericytochromatia bacterium]
MASLEWSDFITEVQQLGAEGLTEDRLFDMVCRLRVDATLLDPHIQFSTENYARHVIYRDEAVEVICLCWMPGQGTPVHNHGRSFGVVCVHEGILACTGFRRLDSAGEPGRAELEATTLVYATSGTRLLDRVGSTHRLSNPAHLNEPAVSLHFYAGPLDWMEVFDLRSGTVEVRPMFGEPVGPGEPDPGLTAS